PRKVQFGTLGKVGSGGPASGGPASGGPASGGPASGGPASGGPASGPASGTVPTLPEPDPPPHAQMTAAAATPTAPAPHHVMTDLRRPRRPKGPKKHGPYQHPPQAACQWRQAKKKLFFFEAGKRSSQARPARRPAGACASRPRGQAGGRACAPPGGRSG